MQFKGKPMNQTCENGKKSNFGPDFGLFWPKFGPQKFFWWVLPLLDVIHYCKLSLYKISKKANEQNMRKWQKNLVSGTILALLTQIWIPKFFLWIWPLLDVRHCCKLSLYAIARKTNEPNLRNGKKPSFGILTHLAQIQAANVFSPPQISGFFSH